ncbi:MAG: DNA internalization-related competence protein ComEC/Rec2, partial [Candidatus Gastranaerophilales bacterium]|nr:DNA internalization-related competence protein ComEC/Rec2 [Candidatus Gastranaerophilales bacterium]
INDSNEKIQKIKIGDTLKLTGELKSPKYAQNPSQFDYSRYLQFKKTFSLLYVNNNWEILPDKTNIKDKILRKLNDTRSKIINIHAQNINSPMLEILGGIIFGDDAVNPDEETKTSFINSGIFHILAASGMNVTLIFGIWFFFARNLRLNYKFSIITGILLILFYTCMTGFGPPIIRAVLMLTFILIGKLTDKSADTISLLFVVAFLMLVFNPLMLYDIGFQLSFTVTFALILTAPSLNFNLKYKPLNYIIGACLIPVIAQIYAAPLQMFYFNTFSVYSVFANIAIIPVLSVVSFIGFISSIIALIPALSVKVCSIADFILNPLLIYIVKVAEFFSNLPCSIIFLKKPVLVQILLFYAIIISITCIFRNKIKSKKINICIISICILFLLTFIPVSNRKAEIIFFSVGNADAALIKSPENEYFIIDTAKTGYKNSNTAAKYIIIKYLKDKGIKKIHSLILTHFDSDHAGGTVDILKELKVKNLYITDVYENTRLSDNIMKYVKENNTPFKNIEGAVNIYDGKDFKINIIKPCGENILNENQKSLIVHLNYKDQNILFMGDGDVESYNALPPEYKSDIAIMKSGHHGAKNTVDRDMAKNTKLFVISTGVNPYNHPDSETLNIITENGSNYLRTDRHNAIKVILNKNSSPDVYMYSPKIKKFVEFPLVKF